MSQQQQQSTTPWCCTAQQQAHDDNDKHKNGIMVVPKDASLSAAAWMQYIEDLEQRADTPGGAGAYDTLRCDVTLLRDGNMNNHNQKDGIHVWGLDYHLDRLQASYQSIQPQVTTEQLQQARRTSIDVMNALLQQAQQHVLVDIVPSQQDHDSSHQDMIQLVRVTWLWSPPLDRDKNDDRIIIVRAHATCTGHPVPIYAPQPIVCSIAVDPPKQHYQTPQEDATTTTTTTTTSLPNRLANPHAKIAAWTKQRQGLEHPDKYKPAGVSEVLLVRQHHHHHHHDKDSRIELLEGLSSNLFVVYRDGTLRTPHNGVLHGYVRHLVLQQAGPAAGLRVDTTTPILVHDHDQWQEAFITSSSRLIYPITKILTPKQPQGNEGHLVWQELWHDEWFVMQQSKPDATQGTTTTSTSMPQPKWQAILQAILRHGGYTIPRDD